MYLDYFEKKNNEIPQVECIKAEPLDDYYIHYQCQLACEMTCDETFLNMYKNIVHMYKSIFVQLVLLLSTLNIFAQDPQARTIIRNLKVIDEVRYIPLENAQFNVYDMNGAKMSALVLKNIRYSDGKEIFNGYILTLDGQYDTIFVEAKVEGYTYVDTTLVLSEDKITKGVGNRYFWNDEVLLKTTLEPYKELLLSAKNRNVRNNVSAVPINRYCGFIFQKVSPLI